MSGKKNIDIPQQIDLYLLERKYIDVQTLMMKN